MSASAPVDPTSDTILDYSRAICAIWIVYKTLTKGQLSRHKFEYESHKNVMRFVKKYAKFLEPLIHRKMRVGLLSTQMIIHQMQQEKKDVAWDGTRLETLYVGIAGVAKYMKMFSIPEFTNEDEALREAEQSRIEDVHLTRMFHKEFPDLPYGFDETQDWPTTVGKAIDPSTVPPLPIYL